MKKIAYLTLLFISCISCGMSKSVKYSIEFHVVNNLGYTIEVFNGDGCFVSLQDKEDIILFESDKCYNFDEAYKVAFGWPPQDVSLYRQNTNSHDLLKIWRFDEREEPGKQLYRLTDSKREVTTEDVDQSFFTNGRFHTWGCFYVRYCFTFTINPEDI